MTRRTRIKICGVTRLDDANLAVELGADMIGLNFFSQSPRYLDLVTARRIATAVPPGVEVIGVFVNEETPQVRHTAWEVGLTGVQFHGDELAHQIFRIAPYRVIKAFGWKPPRTAGEIQAYFRACEANVDEATGEPIKPSAVLVDTSSVKHGGTGETWNWNELDIGTIPAPVFIAGGLNPTNVAAMVKAVRPYGVDVAS